MPVPSGQGDIAPASLAEFKAHLNLAAGTSETDEELALHLNAATLAVEKRIGPILTREFTHTTAARGGGALVVDKTPLVAVTSVTGLASGTVWATEDLDADPAGIITPAAGRFSPGRYTVVYTAGRGDSANEDHKLAVLYVAEHLWEMQQRGVTDRPGVFGEQPSGDASAGFVYRGFALPNRALELLSGDEEIGFA